MAAVAEAVRARAETILGAPQPLRPLLRRARLHRLARALAPVAPALAFIFPQVLRWGPGV
jgi:hypothetical protein